MDNTVARISVSQGNLILYRVSKKLTKLAVLCDIHCCRVNHVPLVHPRMLTPTRMPLFFLFYGAWIALSLSSLLASNRDVRAVINIVFIFSRAGSKAIFPGKSWPVFQVGYVASSFCKSLTSINWKRGRIAQSMVEISLFTLYHIYMIHYYFSNRTKRNSWTSTFSGSDQASCYL